MANYPYLFHTFGFIAFVFLFTLLDTNNKSSILVIFIMMTKSKSSIRA
jgi:hypothetical protein